VKMMFGRFMVTHNFSCFVHGRYNILRSGFKIFTLPTNERGASLFHFSKSSE
jgi:hypothetical protein